ncbi:signal peptidase I [Candidatus Enterococcus mansonii]|uniref:Signal peptidase I n=1 Tax=Candidatus Enterococcus mansonii TaxID=1834181 RepID=A0A242CFG0_9ENTE|nr:signal peptidase I [Enterococcus sp. 4G2_DIV0659]OTO08946.1 signal peptidase I [Enterococcus sp. 4G2_DIV0659]
MKQWTIIFEHCLFSLFFMVALFFLFFTKTHIIDGHSMQPTFSDRDRVLVRKTKTIQRFDIVTFLPENEASTLYVKRVIGLPGDQLKVKGDQLMITQPSFVERSDTLIKDSTTVVRVLTKEAKIKFEKLKTIPSKSYFVLGDNRGNSKDSRTIGLVQSDQIEGVVDFRYYPLNKIGFVH